jgi:hypothetical protein
MKPQEFSHLTLEDIAETSLYGQPVWKLYYVF